MVGVEISNADTVRILHHAFGDAFKTITIITEQDSFKIIGVDETSSIAVQMQIELTMLGAHLFDSSIRFPVFTKDFSTYLGYSTSGYIPSQVPLQMPIRLNIQDTHMDLFITSQNIWSLRKIFLPVPEGIETLPQLPSFVGEPHCTTKNISLLRLCYSVFEKAKKIILKMDAGKITFSSMDADEVFEISGEGEGVASTILLPYVLDVVSKVWELSSIENLKISISQGGLTQFYYTFYNGALWYAAPSSSE